MNAELFSLMQEYLEKIKKTSVPVNALGGMIDFSPFYAMFHVSMVRNSGFQAINGGTYIMETPRAHTINARLSVRMGDYDKGSSSHAVFPLPYVFKKEVAEVLMRKAADMAIWDSIDDYIFRLDDGLGTNNSENSFLSFSKEESARHLRQSHTPKKKSGELQHNLEKVTGALKKGVIVGCGADFCLGESQRYFASTEDTQIYTKEAIWGLTLTVKTVDSDNRVIEHSHSFKGNGCKAYPTLDQLMEEGEKLSQEISEIREAKIEKNGTYPTIMDFNNHGVIWHEVVGHSLEGHRQQDGEHGDAANLFADRMGEIVAPEFITLIDDPTRQDLNAHYPYDEEGVPGQKVVLIENGVLKNFLHSRESAGYMNTKSNGHARAEDSQIPVARMSNLIIESSNKVSYEELKEMLIKECRKQRKPYGLIMSESEGGLTLPSDSMFQTFPTNVFRLYTDGKTERVRGIYLVGTPAQALDNMLVSSDKSDTFDGFCGAESGSISSTITAPDMLLRKVEVNRIPNSSYDILRNPVLPE